jgi:hypothetical protein
MNLFPHDATTGLKYMLSFCTFLIVMFGMTFILSTILR